MKLLLFTASSKIFKSETGFPSCECVAVKGAVTTRLLVRWTVPALICANSFIYHCFCPISPNMGAVKKAWYLSIIKIVLTYGSPEEISGTLMLKYWGRLTTFMFSDVSPVAIWSCHKMLNAMPQWGLPTKLRLMIYRSEYSFFLAELGGQGWENELLMKPFLRAWEDEIGTAGDIDWWFAKVPVATSFLGSITDRVVPIFWKPGWQGMSEVTLPWNSSTKDFVASIAPLGDYKPIPLSAGPTNHLPHPTSAQGIRGG